jgi:hypothetical protein
MENSSFIYLIALFFKVTFTLLSSFSFNRHWLFHHCDIYDRYRFSPLFSCSILYILVFYIINSSNIVGFINIYTEPVHQTGFAVGHYLTALQWCFQCPSSCSRKLKNLFTLLYVAIPCASLQWVSRPSFLLNSFWQFVITHR